MIEIDGLVKRYRRGAPALDGVTLRIGSGMFGLLGANGAGKTTLMRILAGVLRPTSGTAQVFGADVRTTAGRAQVRAILGYLPQELGLPPNLNAYEFLDYMAILKGVNQAQARRAQIAALLEEVGLSEVARKPLRTYSGGMKQRIGIAQALLGDPRLLIVDEPTAGLDPEERIRFRNLLIAAARDRTIILSTHIVEDISYSAHELAVMRAGRVLWQGKPNTLIDRARGHVWVTGGAHPPEGWALVSTGRTHAGEQFRVVGESTPPGSPTPVEPTLEDGYLWLMRSG
jgi:ABC-type multidrug transport system ATPase subunit